MEEEGEEEQEEEEKKRGRGGGRRLERVEWMRRRRRREKKRFRSRRRRTRKKRKQQQIKGRALFFVSAILAPEAAQVKKAWARQWIVRVRLRFIIQRCAFFKMGVGMSTPVTVRTKAPSQ